MRMCRGESHFCQKWPLANVVEFGEYHKWPHFGECESGESVTAFWRNWRIFKLGCFMYKKKDIFRYKTIQSTLAKFAKFAKLAKFAIVLANSSLARTTKGHSLANSSLASLKDFQKWPFWRVLEFNKFAGEWPLLIFNTQIV